MDDVATAVAQYLLKVRWKQPYATIPEVPQVSRLADIAIPDGFTDSVKLGWGPPRTSPPTRPARRPPHVFALRRRTARHGTGSGASTGAGRR
ncbi:hypothetical protein Slala05_76600 [Streptomyces lavendulae subsp. lavendulae]|nr:hypothetical protein Slala05_76600 [Streptomyces lavendulae subsp. lavendulae]